MINVISRPNATIVQVAYYRRLTQLRPTVSYTIYGQCLLLRCADVPRGRRVKYPLLLKSVLKYTPNGHSDGVKLEEAIEIIDDVIKLVEEKSGLAKCHFIKTKFEYLSDDQVCFDLHLMLVLC